MLRSGEYNQSARRFLDILPPASYLINTCGYGGIGRHARFRILCESVQVRALLPAFLLTTSIADGGHLTLLLGVRLVTGVYSEGERRTPLAKLKLGPLPQGACNVLMKILILSDSHRAIRSVEQALRENTDCEYVIFLGDGEDDIDNAEDILPYRAKLAVAGNCDRYSDKPKRIVTTIGGKKFYITHGHGENVKYTFDTLGYAAKEQGCEIALFGHTHSRCDRELGGVRLFNPGSIGMGSYGVITITDDKIEFGHFSL